MGRWGTGPLHLFASSYTRRIFFYVTALLSAVVILSAVASYLVMRAQISKMAVERTLLELQRTATSFSTLFDSSIIPAAEQVFETTEVNSFIYGSSLSPQQLVTATQLLDRFQLANPLIDSIVVYNHQRETVYSTQYGLLAADDSHNTVIMRFFRQISDFGLYRFIARKDGGKRLLTVILGSRPYSGTTLLGGLVVNVSETALRRQLLGRFDSDRSRFTILDNTGVVLSSTDTKQFGTEASSSPVLRKVVEKPGVSGSFTVSDNGSVSLLSFYREPLVGWTFVSATPDWTLFAGIAHWRNEIIVIFSALLALSMVLAMSTSNRVTIPLERLMIQARALKADLSGLGTSHRDDIRLVSETLELLNQRLHDLSANSASSERAFTRVLLDQNVSDDELQPLRARLFDAASGEVWVAALVVDGMEDLQRTPELRTKVLESCHRLSRRLADLPRVLAAGETERGTLAVAVEVTDGDSIFVLPEEMKETVAETMPSLVTLSIGVADPVSNLDELSAAFDSAVEAVHYRFRLGKGATITQADRIVADTPYVLPDAELRRLGEQARLLNELAVEDALAALLQSVRPYSYEDFLFVAQSVLHVLEKVFVDSGALNRRELSDFRSRIMNVKWIETIDDVLILSARWLRRFVEAARMGDTDRLATFVADVRKTVEDSLFDPDLSAKSIAGKLKVSVNYIRSLFKSATGESISNYITRLRIERSKELLLSSDISVKEIAVSAGFRNYNYFFTLFKKQTGRTPQEYQRQFTME